MAELLFGFTDLGNVRNPKTPILNLGTLTGIPDSYVRKFNPSRYNFYVKFVNGLKDPATLYKFLYTLNDAKVYHKNIQNKLSIIAKSLSRLSDTDRNKVIANLKNVLDNEKYDKLFDIIQNFGTNTTKKLGGTIKDKDKDNDNDDNPKNDEIIKKTDKIIDSKEFYVDKPIGPMQTFLQEINKVAPLLGSPPKTNINDIIKQVGDTSTPTKPVQAIDINKVKGIYEGFKQIPKMNPDKINISMIDRGIFIGVTLLIRLITLSLIYWSLNSNIINNFKQAFIYYCLIYILFFIFITAVVNVIYYYPIVELFTNINLTSLPNLLYYFYIHFNGIYSLLLHISIILILITIPFILSMDKKVIDQNDLNISFDYKQKMAIYNSISNFSFVIWILTSVIALKF